mgnify:FL=1
MPAVVTDQFRIANAGNFVDSVLDSNNSYYVFLGLPNPNAVGFGRTTTWNTNTPSPIDNQEYLSHYRNTSLFGKKITAANLRRVVKKHSWVANQSYDMYRHDYRPVDNEAPTSKSGSLYKTNYYVITSEFKVYICLDNGSLGEPGTADAKAVESLDEPTFTDLEPAAAGTQDPYIWKYLFTVSPSDVVKFDSIEYIILPNDWSTSTDPQIQSVRESGDSDINKNQIKTVYIKNQGNNYTDGSYSCNILGDGTGARALVTVDGNIITNVIVTAGGFGYTFAIVDLSSVSFNGIESERANLIPIIPPSKGHGFDIYNELGADKVLVYSRFDDSTKDFPTDTHFGQVGIIKNPEQPTSGILTTSQFSSLSSIKLTSAISPSGVTFDQLVGLGITQKMLSSDTIASGTIASYDQDTFVLKYIQDRSLNLNQSTNDTTDYANMDATASQLSFESSGNQIFCKSGGNLVFSGSVDEDFQGITTTVGNKNINLGVEFKNGLADPEINKKTGDIIYIDNRKEVTRNVRQKEDVKIILEF